MIAALLRRWHKWLLMAAFVVNLGLAAGAAAVWATHTDQTPHRHGDFAAFYTAWTMVRAGDGAHLYDFDAQARRQRAVLEGHPFETGLLPYLNPPHVALVFASLGALPLGRAAALWTAGQLALLLWLLRILWRLAGDRPAFEKGLVAAAVLAAPPVLLTVELGAFSLAIMVAVLKLHESLTAGRDRRAGAWLALGAIKPQLVLMPAVALVAGRRWRAVATAAGVTTVVAVACTAALGVEIWGHFAQALLAVHRTFERFGIRPDAMYNLEGAVLFAFGPAARATAPVIGLAGLGLGILATGWIWRGPWRPGEARFDLQMAATVLVGMFTSLHLYWQDGLLLVAAGVLFDSYLRRSGRPRGRFAALALPAPLVWFVTELLLPLRPVRFPVLVTVVLGVWMARELRRPALP